MPKRRLRRRQSEARPGWGERSPRDLLLIERTADGCRWARYGRYGETVDAFEDFTSSGAAREDALRSKGDVPIEVVRPGF
jgi:hypothetical protein